MGGPPCRCQGRGDSPGPVQGVSIGIKPCEEKCLDSAVVRVACMRWEELVQRSSRLGLALSAWAVGVTAAAGEPRLNQVQVIGTHNSYHIAPASAVLELIGSTGRRRAEGLDYTHRPLAEQFS